MNKPLLYVLIYSLSLVTLFVIGMHRASPAEFPLGGPEDYTIFYTAGQIVADGNAERLYDLPYQSQVQEELLRPYGLSARGGLLPYNYPPFFALVFVPLSRVPLLQSFLLWYGLSSGMVALAAWLLLRDLDPERRKNLVLTILLVFSFVPVLRGLAKGQSSAIMLVLLAVTYLALKHKRDGLAGAALAAAMIKPQLALPFVLVLLLLRRWRALLAFALTALALLAISGLLVGPKGLTAYMAAIKYSAAWTGQAGFYPEVMPNIRGTVYRLSNLLEDWTTIRLSIPFLIAVTVALSLAGLAVLVSLWRDSNSGSTPEFGVRFAATLSLILLLTPHSYDHDLILLVLAAFPVVGYFAARREITVARNGVTAGHMAPWLALFVLSAPAQAQMFAVMLAAIVLLLYVSFRRNSVAT